MVDTNVPLVANRQAPQAEIDCVLRCVDTLEAVRAGDQVLLDDLGLIFHQYGRQLSHSGQPGVGDAFFKWLWDNQGVERYCRKVRVTPTEGSFAEFPDDSDLAGFDPDDRVFVAVALTSKAAPPILNASDTDWWDYREPLRRNGVEVRFLCPDLMKKDKR